MFAAFKKPLVELFVVCAFLFIMHKSAFYFLNFQIAETHFVFALFSLYLFFFSSSLLIVVSLLFVKQKNINNVGNVFMLLTCIKMGFCYVLLHPILRSQDYFQNLDKINFFIIFASFLTIETIITIRILNNSQ